ncbi:MAG: hypothetical protein IJI41_04980 [Anaerolineaceae bacterium]|nr:hypothetical protein [Anaerolineaceae bacterium]
MKTDVIKIDNMGNGFTEAIKQCEIIGAWNNLSHKDQMHLQLLTEEMLSLARSITGEMKASFWIENDGKNYELHMTTKTVMDAEKRYLFIESSSSKKNEAAKTILGVLRDVVELMMTPSAAPAYPMPFELASGLSDGIYKEQPMWDGYERSILLKVADNVKVGIRGDEVDITVLKSFGE